MKIAILCGTGLDAFHQEVLKPIMADPSMEVVGVYLDSRSRPSLKKRFLKNLKRGRGVAEVRTEVNGDNSLFQ